MGRGWVYVGGWLTGGVDVSGYVCVGVMWVLGGADWGCSYVFM